ncbi:adenosylcobinamide-GDP ribazoletransferase [Atlantibacter hermannii]|uniref:adenosylcobinamide-GDP ribazoletransferase n=1 Tax=Atlantibacter hermannii TaxID=565 RepID=UPI001933F95D|nr:adenosylcobinamide-GDP ribazoletransferase [Atlantibacter hermannii]MBL7637761.1 adenosylcobinamide-GDP ribazoletransferase [Atlantibacter hermannii]MBL7675370.1 adenosylcobinamide-GDP ribazoletransferase [Atlantibacter hermannii]
MIRTFFATLAFMSRLPVPYRWSQGLELDQYSRGIVFFPWVGMVLGAIAAAVFILLAPWCGTPLAALFYVLALALLTGGFHLDGLADTCDGLFSARIREKKLEIMRDSRLGTHGGLGLIFVLLAKVLVVNELALRGYSMLPVLILASVVGRGAVVLLMYRQRYARDNGLGNIFIGKVTLAQTAMTLATSALLCLILLPGGGLLAWLIAAVAIALIGFAIKRTLRGQTGDTLGAAIELGELLFLIALL